MVRCVEKGLLRSSGFEGKTRLCNQALSDPGRPDQTTSILLPMTEIEDEILRKLRIQAEDCGLEMIEFFFDFNLIILGGGG